LKIERILVGRGRSVPTDGPEGEWLKTFYQVEAVLDEGEDPKAVRLSLERMLNRWLSGEAEPKAKVPKLDLAELEELPWTTYKTKERAKEGEAGWIFANTEGAEELVKAIQRSEGKLELGPYEYRFSGKERQFITRRPLKVKK
jgi:hypothetical protein